MTPETGSEMIRLVTVAELTRRDEAGIRNAAVAGRDPSAGRTLCLSCTCTGNVHVRAVPCASSRRNSEEETTRTRRSNRNSLLI